MNYYGLDAMLPWGKSINTGNQCGGADRCVHPCPLLSRGKLFIHPYPQLLIAGWILEASYVFTKHDQKSILLESSVCITHQIAK